jgi:hypothetical protein
MIIFFKKDTGRIIGTIEGRVHGEMHLKQWVGNKEETERLIVQWIKNEKIQQYEPDVTDLEQKEIFIQLDKNPIIVYDFYIDIKSKKIMRKAN